MDRKDALGKYKRATIKAELRGLKMRLTFDEWCNIWLESGHWEERGPHSDQYCMARNADLGDYELGNVSIQLSGRNNSDAHRGKKLTSEHKAKIGAAQVGRRHTAETKAKMSISASARKVNNANSVT